jgi:hypothetical protein
MRLGNRGVNRREFLDRGEHPHAAQDRPPRHAGLRREAPRQRPRRETDVDPRRQGLVQLGVGAGVAGPLPMNPNPVLAPAATAPL